MPSRLWSHIRGNVVAYIALFVALTGTAVASSVKLAANSVGTAQLKNGAVTGQKRYLQIRDRDRVDTQSGSVGCDSTNVTQMMGGVQNVGVMGTSRFLAPEGLTPSPAPTAESDGLGASAVAGTGGNLDVGISSALETFPITFTLDVNDAPTGLACTIPAGGTTCEDSAHTVSIPPGALVDISVQGSISTSKQVVSG